MIVLDLSILNQKGTPMFNSDTFANRPAFGIVGRIFISIDTAAIYRDTGSAWDLIADGGSSSTNIYNSNGTLSANRVVSDGGFGLSFTPTTHIGTATIGGGGSGKLIVGSSTADNGIQIFGANAPSLRIDNAQSGGTQRFILGLATSTNNFIQGAIASDFCITTASSGAILFGMWQSINASEVMRISTASNLIVGSTADNGNRLQITGTGYFSGNVGIAVTNPLATLHIGGSGATNLYIQSGSGSDSILRYFVGSNECVTARSDSSANYRIETGIGSPTEKLRITGATGNVLINTTTDAGQKLQVAGMLKSGISYRSGTYTDGDTTPSVSGISYLYIQNSGATSITNFTNGIANQIIILIFNDTNTTVTRNNAYLSGGVNFTSTAGDLLTLIYDGTIWYEVCRSINS